jgi:hypothetical protein
MHNLAKRTTWLALALLPVVFLLAGRHWGLAIVIGLTAIPLTLALAALRWEDNRPLRWAALAVNLLLAAIASMAFIHMARNIGPPPNLLEALPVVAAAIVLAIAPWLNSFALFRAGWVQTRLPD